MTANNENVLETIEYSHDRNLHTREGATRGLSYILTYHRIKNLLDVGAGTGSWLRAAQIAGVEKILGVDGVPADCRRLCIDPSLLQVADLRLPLNIGLRFDAVLCLEVAEHLPENCAATLVESLCNHSDLVFFAAAAPAQMGDHHINCQWPSYWQAFFNKFGFTCSDDIRFEMWSDHAIEPWYRQNIFCAQKDLSKAGLEPRILSLIHPDMISCMDFPESPSADRVRGFENGALHPRDYARLLSKSIYSRLRRRVATKIGQV